MPKLSESISHAILRVTDAAAGQLDNFAPEQKERLWPLTREHLPPSLFDSYAARTARFKGPLLAAAQPATSTFSAKTEGSWLLSRSRGGAAATWQPAGCTDAAVGERERR